MVLSHNDTTFPYRRQLLVGLVGLLAVVAVLAPSESWLQRSIAPLKLIIIGALAYGSVWLILRILEMMQVGFAKLYALFCYYGGMVGAVVTPIAVAVSSSAAENGPLPFGSSAYFAEALPAMAASVCAVAAAYKWLRPAYDA